MGKNKSELPVLGWREWLHLPELGIGRVKAKIDTGARSSSLHAFDVQEIDRCGELFVRFKVHPKQRRQSKLIMTEAKVLEFRNVRSSSGHIESRPVVVTLVSLLGQQWPIELTLTDRGAMGFRMLVGREALRGRFIVNPEQSFCGGKPQRWQKLKASKTR